MAKEFTQDITPPSNGSRPRGIRNVTAPERARFGRTPETLSKPRKSGSGSLWIWILATVLVFALAVVGALTVFAQTTVTLTPRTHTTVFDGETVFTAFPADGSESQGGSSVSLTYKTAQASFVDSVVAQSSGVEDVEERASGRITVFNEFSDSSVRLIPNTRFETPAGLVFRAQGAIVIPGRTVSRGEIIPGQVEVTVFAAETGERHNIGPVARFTLPGLATSPDMFEAVYARSTESMTGGFSGTRPRVSSEDREIAQDRLRGRLEERAREDFASTLEENEATFSELVEITFVTLPFVVENGEVMVRMQADARAPVFSHTNLGQALASATIASAAGTEVRITNSESANAERVGNMETEYGTDPIDFVLSGRMQFEWVVNAGEVAKELAGRDRDSFQSVVSNFPGIEEASAQFRPLWRSSFPEDPANIKVKINSSVPVSL